MYVPIYGRTRRANGRAVYQLSLQSLELSVIKLFLSGKFSFELSAFLFDLEELNLDLRKMFFDYL